MPDDPVVLAGRADDGCRHGKLAGVHVREDLPEGVRPALVQVELQAADFERVRLLAGPGLRTDRVHGHEDARRFLIARALGDSIGRQAPGPAVLEIVETPRQAHSRAFAAELLAPAETLRFRVGASRTIDSDAMDELAEDLCVSLGGPTPDSESQHRGDSASSDISDATVP